MVVVVCNYQWCSMDLPWKTMRGLANVQEISSLSEEAFFLILENVISRICKSVEANSLRLPDSRPGTTKSTFADLSRAFVEAARYDLDEEGFRNFLSVANLSDSRTKKILDVYVRNKTAIQECLGTIGCDPPHVIDVDWRLDYRAKLDTCNSLAVPAYHVRLTAKDHGQDKCVTFTCTIQQLQELVSKLKDASRHLEKLTNV